MGAQFYRHLYAIVLNILLDLEWDEVVNRDIRDIHEDAPVDKVEGEEQQGEDYPRITLNITCSATKKGDWNLGKFRRRN